MALQPYLAAWSACTTDVVAVATAGSVPAPKHLRQRCPGQLAPQANGHHSSAGGRHLSQRLDAAMTAGPLQLDPTPIGAGQPTLEPQQARRSRAQPIPQLQCFGLAQELALPGFKPVIVGRLSPRQSMG